MDRGRQSSNRGRTGVLLWGGQGLTMEGQGSVWEDRGPKKDFFPVKNEKGQDGQGGQGSDRRGHGFYYGEDRGLLWKDRVYYGRTGVQKKDFPLNSHSPIPLTP